MDVLITRMFARTCRLKFSKDISDKGRRGSACARLAFQAQVNFAKMACDALSLDERPTSSPATLRNMISTHVLDPMTSEMPWDSLSCDLLVAYQRILRFPLASRRYCLARTDSTKHSADGPDSSSKLSRETIADVKKQT